MDIKYKKNCQLYYDENQKATFIVKRNTKFMIKNSPEDYRLLRQIIGRAVKKAAVEEVVDEKDRNNIKALQYIKLLLDKGILYTHQDTNYPLEVELQDYIISNFDDHYRVLDFISQSKIAVKNDQRLADLYGRMGMNTSNIEEFTEKVRNQYDIYIGDFKEEELYGLLRENKHVLLLRRSGGACSILYMNHYDEELLDQYRRFYINSPSASEFGRIILPINILIHLLENVFSKEGKNLRYITADAAVQLFQLKDINKDSLQYYDRTMISKNDDLTIIRKIEEMTKTSPNFIKETNRDNNLLCHAPVCNYEVLFGYSLNNHKSSRYHEDNAKAGILAIIEGMEQALTDMNPYECWVCATSLEEYYLKGYLRLLSALEEAEPAVEIVTSSEEIASLLKFISQCYRQRLKLYYQNIYKNIVGNVYITDARDRIVYTAKNTWQPERAIKEGLYDIIGRCENEQDLPYEDQLSYAKGVAHPKDRTAKEMLSHLSDYFSNKSILVDEKPWAYLSCFEPVGIHMGGFYIVK
jgi:hypothetical protein